MNDMFAAFFAIAAPIEEALLNVAERAVSQRDAAAPRIGNEYFYAAAAEYFPAPMEFFGSDEYLVIYRAQ
ncbi:MAG TPA: hypothetical protein VJ810_26500 [Blastocatellia bacterium]|nr:hypothetical protein [Blastocatellia bacterium]